MRQTTAIYCTRERMLKSRELIIEPRETGSAGNIIMTGQRELQECALDVLFRNGRLGSGQEARDRYNVGLWLRELHFSIHPSSGVGAYSPLIGTDSGEMSEAMAWNVRCYLDTGRALKRHWRVLEQVCCEDIGMGNPEPVTVALDALYEHRDGYVSDYLASFEKALENE